jgi:glutamine synthetase type III
MSKEETVARADAMHEQYAGMVEIELKCMIEMVSRQCVPACKEVRASTSPAPYPELQP